MNGLPMDDDNARNLENHNSRQLNNELESLYFICDNKTLFQKFSHIILYSFRQKVTKKNINMIQFPFSL